MVHVVRELTVKADPDQVVDYLKDFSRAEEWDPGTVRCVRQDAGEVRVGSRWRNTSSLLGLKTDLDYELTELTDRKIVFVGRNSTATSEDRITVRAGRGGSVVTYEATVTFAGLAKVADPVMKLVFLKLAADTVTQLTRSLDALAA